jgi:hypothetical protein
VPIFLDFEASGLGPASYPLEVAWGDTATGEVESHLIDPTPIPEWDAPIEDVALQMHGLTRDHLAEHGEHPDRVARRMNEALAGRTAYATSDYDRMWLGELFAEPDRAPDFRLVDVAPLWDGLLAGGPIERIEQADAEAWKRLRAEGWRPHRAANDVRHLMAMYQILALGY